MKLFKNQAGFNDVVTMTIIGGILGSLFITGVFVWQEINKQKEINNLITQINERASKKINIEDVETNCDGVWQFGKCVPLNCKDSDGDRGSDDVYIKGSIITIDEDGSPNVSWDECSGSKRQVNEGWCTDSGLGGVMVYDCPNGCSDGACIKDLCIDEFRSNESGMITHPIDPKYEDLRWLSQIFSSANCEQERIEKIHGVTDGEFTIGLNIGISLYAPEELRNILLSLGFGCRDDIADEECIRWTNKENMPLEDLLKLEPFYEYMSDDCIVCG